jgi:hypothetical protein
MNIFDNDISIIDISSIFDSDIIVDIVEIISNSPVYSLLWYSSPHLSEEKNFVTHACVCMFACASNHL